MSRLQLFYAAISLVVLSGCDDGAVGEGTKRDAAVLDMTILLDARVLPPPDAAPPIELDMASPMPDPDAAVIEPQIQVQWIEVILEPREEIYELDDSPIAVGEAFDRHGEPLEDVEITWQVVPEGIAQITPEGRLTFIGEGQGTVIGCAGESPCGRAAFYVDAEPPFIELESPARGAVLSGLAAQTIAVRGRASDSSGQVTVRINDERVELDAEGRFSIDLPAQFGLNRVLAEANDGVRRRSARDRRDVLWAPSFAMPDPTGFTIQNALTMQIDQALLDRDTPVELPDEAGEVTLTELAQLIDAILQLADLNGLFADPQIIDGDAFSLRIDGIDLGTPEIELALVPDGLELFIRVSELRIGTQGRLNIEGEEISLDGQLRIGLAAFSHLTITLRDGELAIEVDEVGIAAESIGGEFDDPAAGVLVTTLGSQLRSTAIDLASAVVDQIVRERLPELLEAGLSSLLGAISDLPLNLDTGIEGLPAIQLRLGMTPVSLRIVRDSLLEVQLEGRISHGGEPPMRDNDPGVPLLPEAEQIPVPGEGIQLKMQLTVINGLLHALWRAGIFDISPPLPADLRGVLGEVALEAALPPVVVPVAGGAYPFELQVGELRLIAAGFEGAEPDVFALSLRAGLSIGVQNERLVLGLDDALAVDATLLEQGGERPILSDTGLVRLLQVTILPFIGGALGSGLSFGLPGTSIDIAPFQRFAPRLSGLSIAPRFDADPRVRSGQVSLEGGMLISIELGE